MLSQADKAATGRVNLVVTITLLVCVTLIILGSVRRWRELYSRAESAPAEAA